VSLRSVQTINKATHNSSCVDFFLLGFGCVMSCWNHPSWWWQIEKVAFLSVQHRTERAHVAVADEVSKLSGQDVELVILDVELDSTQEAMAVHLLDLLSFMSNQY
jgi:hypothetical protein